MIGAALPCESSGKEMCWMTLPCELTLFVPEHFVGLKGGAEGRQSLYRMIR